MNKGYVASIDIGSTAVKGVLVNAAGELYHEVTVPVETDYREGHIEQDPESWWQATVQIANTWWREGVDPAEVRCLVCSGQMQDCIPVDESGKALYPAILYSDGRAEEEANKLARTLGVETMREVTGNHFDGTFPLAKIVWLRDHEPDIYRQTQRFLFGAKDYVIYKCTRDAVVDPTTASTVGLMNQKSRTWQQEWLPAIGVEADKLPQILAAHECVGTIGDAAAAVTGFAADTPILCGIGDAGASTLGAGVMEEGDQYAYLGTTGWVAASTSVIRRLEGGVFHLAHPVEGLSIAIAPLLNAGNAHKWGVKLLGCDTDDYDGFEKLAAACDRGKNSVLFLPYLNGERCPIQDPDASGSFVGMRTSAGKEELAAAVLEGISFAVRHVQEYLQLPDTGSPLTLIGGGSRSAAWCQILSEVTKREIQVPADSQFLPALGAAAIGFTFLGWAADYRGFREQVLHARSNRSFAPAPALLEHYDRQYAKYVRLYLCLKDIT
ncbi:xylulokinase [Brevibacillus fluminis]|uniref:xylulokinase n=1 Tax=Brevibacillus fluminis TaxID=511487 RepID=UPI003F892D7F